MPAKDARLAELLGALSLASDVAWGFPPEKAMRSAVLAVELGRRHGLAGEELRDVYYTALTAYLGGTAFAHEMAHIGAGDDLAMIRSIGNMLSDPSSWRVPRFLASVAGGLGARVAARFALDQTIVRRHAVAVCEAAVHFATMCGVSKGVCTALTQVCESWDGTGGLGVAGDALHLPIRYEHLACFVEIAHHREGRAAAVALVRKRGGRQFDPALAKTFLAHADELLEQLEGDSIWERFLVAEPEPHARAGAARVDDVARAFAEVADVKSVWTLGHSTGVAALAARAGEALGLGEEEARQLRRAALLHDVGRVSAPNRIWDKPGPLTPTEWESVRLHAYWTERVLAQSPLLREAAQVASAAHERLDGGGYHRAAPSAMLGRAARLLAAADAYHAMGEARPHRPALGAEPAAAALLLDVESGKLDREAAHAVLDAAGVARARARPSWPRGLTDREVEVLRLVARGQSNKEIAATLGISPRTAQHHVIHIYQKIDVTSRAGAAIFAIENDLL